MHYRGKSFELTAEFQGEQKTILNVPNYDFNWQHLYQLKEPIPISEIKSLQFTAAFDNSENNPANPDAKQHVTWGDQTWEEMAVGFVIVSEPRNGKNNAVVELTEEEKVALAEKEKAIEKEVAEFVDDFFRRFDANNNGTVELTELPRSTRRFGRWNIDLNGDGTVTREEVEIGADARFRHRSLIGK